MIFLDFETRSFCSLPDVGAERYACDSSTSILCLAWAVDDRPVEVTTNFESPPFCYDPATTVFVAHNAGFERAIWRYLLPAWPLPEVWIDTAALSRIHGLPGKLELVSDCLHLEAIKDKKGKSLIDLFSKPRRTSKKRPVPVFAEPAENPEAFADFLTYCAQDVRTMRALYHALPYRQALDLTSPERRLYDRNYRQNVAGLRVDAEFVRNASKVVDAEETRAAAELAEITSGAITSVNQSIALAKFCGLPDVGRNTVIDALADGSLEANAAAALRIRQDVGRASVKKLRSIESRLIGDRIHDVTVYHGAHTGRETGTGPQPLNLAQGNKKLSRVDIERIIERIKAGNVESICAQYGSVLGALSWCMRGIFLPTAGFEFCDADLNAIEARLTFWFADQTDALAVYRANQDIYRHTASEIYSVLYDEITAEQRDIGKRAVLGLGYGMGWKRFVEMARAQGRKHVSETLARRAVDAYRSGYHRVPEFWRNVEATAMDAIISRGVTLETNKINFRYLRQSDFLVCTLPSGRPTFYYQPRIDFDSRGHRSLSYYGKLPAPGAKWGRRSVWGGALVENIVQSTARDLLFGFCASAESRGFRIVLSVYDEILAEVQAGSGESKLAELCEIMSTPPDWCADLPLSASGWYGNRYEKG